ncbi:LytR C-terminal domain-containing protein [Sphingomonas sp. HDW15A]|uniref:LytR C-terminal domain-containing protein n=1 Tax=Sphingomonas sp. HDW15A TaxID=2714942 RepID=UPI0019D2973F|nr:LytR C-terminal domain-containing protein [Sphingomonas sp. HDW15A]
MRILNAARVQGIAARTRNLLAAKGIGQADIGNAPARREKSELHYSKLDAERARALARKLPFKVMLVERSGPLTLLVGRNAAP